MTLYEQWLEAFSNVGINAISNDTCAKLLAILYVFGGGQEFFVFNKKCFAEVKYAQKLFNIGGTCIPTVQGIELIQMYVKDLEEQQEPKQWAKDFIKDRYNEALK